jgi:hypothetical protein
MALSIGVSVGSKVDVGGHVVQVKTLVRPNKIVVTVDNGAEIVINESRTQILPTVFVFVGIGQVQQQKKQGGNRLAFEAPKSIRISRIP